MAFRSTLAALGIAAAVLANAPGVRSEDLGVRILFGVKDRESADWSGTARVEGPGSVDQVSVWRFESGDSAGSSSWQVQSRAGKRRSNQPSARGRTGPTRDNGVQMNVEGATADSAITIETEQGEFTFRPGDIPYGTSVERLDGRVRVERTGTSAPITSSNDDEDFPEAVLADDGTTYLTFTRFRPTLPRAKRVRGLLRPPASFDEYEIPPGGDQVVLLVRHPDGKSEEVAISPAGADVYRSAVALDGAGRAWVFWSERREGQFDVFARSWNREGLTEELRLSSSAGSDLAPVATTAPDGRVWVAWQGIRDGVFRILMRRQETSGTGRFAPERRVSDQTRSCWSPTIAATAVPSPQVTVAWDTYEKGDYDVWYATYDGAGKRVSRGPAANSRDYEARSHIVYDADGRLWFGFEESGESWGKDHGTYAVKDGVGVYVERKVGLRVLAPDGSWLDPAGEIADALPVFLRRPGPLAARHEDWLTIGGTYYRKYDFNTLSRLAVDRAGRVWALVRSRQQEFHTKAGELWLEWAAYHDGDGWVGPILLPRSDNFLYSRPTAVAPTEGGLRVFYPSDHRQRKRPDKFRDPEDATRWFVADEFPNDLFESRLPAPEMRKPSAFTPTTTPLLVDPGPSEATIAERKIIARARAYRTTLRGEPMILLRGEFHRHTEISGDGGDDGPIEDMWRYAIDVADMDWIGNGDHDAGHGREYPWWLLQKGTDAFGIEGRLVSMFSYERSRPWPEGHRNVVFARRGIRVLPTLPLARPKDTRPAPDTELLYRYLRHFDGISAPHTSATNMGTDWRNRSDQYEPLVEIFQGARESYEREGAPRAPRKGRGLGGWQPKGFVNVALKKGLKLGFVASSDHRSSHISYANLYVREPTREAVLDALKTRRAYGSTDNIIAEMRCLDGEREFFMGEIFDVATAPDLRIHLEGSAPFARVVLIKDDEVVKEWEPGTAVVDLHWVDPVPTPGEQSYYYVRGEQADEELVWLSPMWIRYQPGE